MALSICQVLAGDESGGLERHFAELCNALAARGHRVSAIAHPRHGAALSAQVAFEPLDLARSRRHPKALLDLHRALRRVRPALVHAQAGKAAAMVATLRFGRRCPAVATVHNIKRRQRALRHFDRVIAVSDAVAATLTAVSAVIVCNGVEPPVAPGAEAVRALREQLGAAEEGLVLAAGRLVPAKGFDRLLAAWHDIDARLLIAGEGPQRPALERAIADAGLGARVRLLGHRQDIPALMSAADLVVMPSRHEGLPYVLLEALHLRRPVLATPAADAAGLLPADWRAPSADDLALGRLVRRALAEPQRLQQALRPVWERAARELTLDAMVGRTEALYRQVLGD